MNGNEPFDFGVFDEAHKTTGKNYFGLALLDENIPIKKRLFMTATPRHFDINKKNKAGDPKLVFSMDDEKLYGPRAYTLSFRKSIELGITVGYKVVVSVVESKKHLSDQTEMEEKTIGLLKAIEKFPEVSKIITFHNTIENAYHFYEHIKTTPFFVDYPCFHVSGLLPTHTRTTIMSKFHHCSKSIITNAKCLSEGVDAPAVDVVAFMNKKSSKIDIIQTIGRAMRLSPGKKMGYVFLPLFIDKDSGESIESSVERANFTEIWNVLQALREHDDSLNETIKNLRREKGKNGLIGEGFEKYLDFIFDASIKQSLQNELSKKISVIIINKIGGNWYEMFGALQAYKYEFGHCNVPERFTKNTSLASWVKNQRQDYKKEVLSIEKIKLLESIGFEWRVHDKHWQKKYAELLIFKRKHKHCNVTYNFASNLPLASWVNNQRQDYKNGSLSTDKIILLESIGFEWSVNDERWQRMYEKLIIFQKKHNHCNVSEGFSNNSSLSAWVCMQRQSYKKNKLSSDKVMLLEAIGFSWDPLYEKREELYGALLDFKRKYDHCNVPRGFPENASLATWVHSIRKSYNKGQLNLDKIKFLESIGFEWKVINSLWHKNYNYLLKYKENHGNCNVSEKKPQDASLARWLFKQREHYKKNRLSPEKIQLLEHLGIQWETLEARWESFYKSLLEFKEKRGHCNVPSNFIGDN